MIRDVYADLLFFVNFSMDYLCFYMTAKLLHRYLPMGRSLAASVLGGIYAVAALFLSFTVPWSLVADLAVCLGMNALAFANKKEKGRGIFLCTAVYFAVSALLGGCMTALYSLFNRAGGAEEMTEDGIGAVEFLLLAGAGVLLTCRIGRMFRRKSAVSRCRLEIQFAGQCIAVDAMCDSGNLLREPIGGMSVVLLDADAAEPLLGAALCHALLGGEMPSPLAARLRPVPASGAVGKGLLIAVRPDKMIVTDQKGKPHVVNACFALTHLSAADGCKALISPELLV